MVSIYLGNLLRAQFIERVNRFVCTVLLDGNIREVHLHDPGRLKELLVKGVPVLLREEPGPHRRTHYDMVIIYKNSTPVCCDSRVPNQLTKRALQDRALPELPGYHKIIPEYSFQDSRLDFCLDNRILIEVKGVSLVRDDRALFPDAPTSRGRRHLETLISATHQGYTCYVLFLVQRPDASTFSPNRATDPQFAVTLQKAAQEGVNLLVYTSTLQGTHIHLKEKITSIIL
ncbi:MAG: DNA/RNA nuclease SfsA [Theionarchaea archaeon]|nr:DNA/RNA nuclease SfsA [Theionarchaea archaeon]MBU6999327.1 DNA/RNA nuclease SfsA [Theionarchaea archaeon]MBU7019881.1 DNA/RNA nuclease SfsA [Theionarchaea archaeon]MBU7035281.1 DNA/RNA nuclease SfsA [Theionarchaea archaeon]MBU7040941.1 DNA/RNA nuclease SfsA [Theionarchaea archaeon]